MELIAHQAAAGVQGYLGQVWLCLGPPGVGSLFFENAFMVWVGFPQVNFEDLLVE